MNIFKISRVLNGLGLIEVSLHAKVIYRGLAVAMFHGMLVIVS
jgi:hypothetical protein